MLTAGTDTYTYDANGSVTAKTTGGGAVTTFTYDFQNRITQITAPTASESSQYSPDGSRVFVRNAAIGGALGPMYDTISNPVLDMDAAGSVGIYRLYGPGIDEPLGEWRRVSKMATGKFRKGSGFALAVELLTALVFLDLVYVSGRFFRQQGMGRGWRIALLIILVIGTFAAVLQYLAARSGGRLRKGLLVIETPLGKTIDAIHGWYVFPFWLLGPMWLSLLVKEKLSGSTRLDVDLKYGAFNSLVRVAGTNDPVRVREAVRRMKESPGSLSEYLLSLELNRLL